MQRRKLHDEKLALTNDGKLRIFTLGCGGAFARTLGQNNYLIVKGENHILIDCGSKTPARLRQCGVETTDIRNYLITHSHADHIGGLEEVMLFGRYVARTKPVAFIEEEYQRILWSDSLRGGAGPNERHDGKPLGFEDFWEVRRPKRKPRLPRNCAEFTLGDLNLKIFRTNHFPEQARTWKSATYSVGVLIDDRVLFTGDTKFDPLLVSDFEQHFDIDVIFQDAQFFKGGIHASIDELSTLPEKLRRRMYLMHYADSYQSRIEDVNRLGFGGFLEEFCWYKP